MKKLIFVLSIIMMGATLQAQDIAKNAIGIRLAEGVVGNEGFGPEITYQRQVFSPHNRFDFNVSFRGNTWRSTVRGGAYFHWTYNIVDNLNWFAGPGVGIGHISFKDSYTFGNIRYERDGAIFGYVGADFGVDYRFNFPLQVAFSIRPSLDIHGIDDQVGFDNVDGHSVNVGVSARYTF